MTDTAEIVKEETQITEEENSDYNVLFLNDDKTSFEFVIIALMSIFNKGGEEAESVTMSIHNTGKGIAGTYPFEEASAKQMATIQFARANGFPLQVQLEEV